MAQLPIFEQQQTPTNVRYSSEAGSALMDTANASQRLMSRLKGAESEIIETGKHAIQEETVKKALKDVEEGRIDSNSVALVAQNVYRQTATNAFIADIEVSSKTKGDGIVNQQTLQGRFDFNGFNKTWDTYERNILKGVTDTEAKYHIQNRLSAQRANFGSQIATLQTKQQREIQSKNFEAKLAMDTDALYRAMGVNGEEQIRLFGSGYSEEKNLNDYGEIGKTLQGMVNAGLIAENVAMLKLQETAKKAYQEENMRIFQSSDDKTKFLDYFIENSPFTSDETQAMVESFHKRLEQNIKNHKIVDDEEERQAEIDSKEIKAQLDILLASSKLDDEILSNAFTAGYLDSTEYDNYYSRMQTPGVSKSNMKSYIYYLKNMDITTKEQIFADTTLSDDDKLKLADKFDSEEKEILREARQEINNRFQIFEGTITSRTDFDNQIGQDYTMIKARFYDEYKSLKPEEATPSRILKVARELLKEYDSGSIVGTQPYYNLSNTTATKEKDAQIDKKPEKVNGANNFSKFIDKLF